MLNRFARAFFTRLFTPVAGLLLRPGRRARTPSRWSARSGSRSVRWRSSRRGHLLAGTLVITAFVFSDTVDGIMARQSGASSRGAPTWTPRSTGSATRRSSAAWCCGSPAAATTGSPRPGARLPDPRLVVSYAKARAEGLGHDGQRRHRRARRPAGRACCVATGLSGSACRTSLLTVVLALLARGQPGHRRAARCSRCAARRWPRSTPRRR